MPPNNFFYFSSDQVSTMSGKYTLGQEYTDQAYKPDALTKASVGLPLGDIHTKTAAVPKQIQTSDFAASTSGFGLNTVTKTLDTKDKADTITTTITTFGPPWLPMMSGPPEIVFEFHEVRCSNRPVPPVTGPFVLLEPPVAHVGEERLRSVDKIFFDKTPKYPVARIPAARLVPEHSKGEASTSAPVVQDGVPTRSSYERRPHPSQTSSADLPGSLVPADGGSPAKGPKEHQSPTPVDNTSRPHVAASVDPPAPSKTHSQDPGEPKNNLDGVGQPMNTNTAFATQEPKTTLGPASPGNSGQASGSNPFKQKPGKSSPPEQKSGGEGGQPAAGAGPGQTDAGTHESGRGDTSSEDAEAGDPSNHNSKPYSGSSQPDQNLGHNEVAATSGPGQSDGGTTEPGRGDTSLIHTGTDGSFDHNANAPSGSSQPDQSSGHDQGQTIGAPQTGVFDQGSDRPEQSGPPTDDPKKGDPSDHDANESVNPIINPSISSNLSQSTLQPLVKPGGGHDYPEVNAIPAQGSDSAALIPDHHSPQGSIGAAAEGASVFVSVESGGILDVGTSKIKLAAPSASQAPLIIGNEVITPDPQGAKINNQIIHPGGPGIEIPDPEGSVAGKPSGAAPQDAGIVVSLGSGGILAIGNSNIDLAGPSAPHAPVTIGNQILAPDPQGFKVNDQVVTPGGPAITIPSPEKSIAAKPAANPAANIPAFLTAAIGSNTVFPTGLAVAGNYIRPGGPEVTISGTGVALDKPGHLIVAGTAIDATSPDDYNDSGGQQRPADAPGIAIAGQTITPGGPPLTVSGAEISLGQSGVLRIGSLTTTLAAPEESGEPLRFTFTDHEGIAEVLRATPVASVAAPVGKQQPSGAAGPGIEIGGQTLRPGSPQVTVSGKAVSLGQSGILRIGSLTTTIASPQPSDGPLAFTLAGADGNPMVLGVTPVSVAEPTAALGFAIAGQMLTAGGPQLTVSGEAISLGESGILRIGSLTRTLGPEKSSAGPLRVTFHGDDGTARVLDVTPVSVAAAPTEGRAIAIAGKTLVPGGAQVTVSGEAISLGESGILRIGNVTTTLGPQMSEERPLGFTSAAGGDGGTAEGSSSSVVTPTSAAAPTDGHHSSGNGAAVEGSADRSLRRTASWSCVFFLVFFISSIIMMCI